MSYRLFPSVAVFLSQHLTVWLTLDRYIDLFGGTELIALDILAKT